jgi:hypothetical protein
LTWPFVFIDIPGLFLQFSRCGPVLTAGAQRGRAAVQIQDFKFEIPNSRACTENDSRQKYLRAAKKFTESG